MRTLALGIGATLALSLGGCAEMNDVLNSAMQTAASVNLVRNGSFEEPVVPVGRYQLFTTGQSFPGWTVIGAQGNVAPISGEYASGGIKFVAQQGAQWIDMSGLSNTATGIQQPVSTQAGAQYTLTFYVGNVVGRGFGSTSAVEALVDGKSMGIFRNDANTPGLQNWRLATVNFTAATATTTIAFINRDASNDQSCGLDNVSLRKVTPPAGS